MPRDERNRKRRNRQSGAPRANQQAHKQVEQPKKQETPKSQPQQRQTVQKATVPRQTSATRAQRQTHKRFDSPRTQSPGRTASTTTNVSRPVRNRSIETRTQRQTHKIYNEPTNVRDSSVRTDRQSRERYQQRRAERSRVNEGRAAQHFLHEEAEAVKRGAKGVVRGWQNTIEELPERAGVSATDDASIKVQAMRMGQNPNDKKFTDRLKEIRIEEANRKAEARQKRVAQQQKEQAEFEERTKNDSPVAKAFYGGTEAGTGMLADIGLGALAGLATGGVGTGAVSLGAMGMRIHGSARAEAELQGATPEEAVRYADAETAKEIGTESMFRGMGFARGYASKSALSIGDKLANKLTGNLTGKAADFVGAGIKYGSGIAEENIEEAVGWLADPVISEATYQKGVRERRQKQIKAQMKDESDALRAQITSEQSARAAAAYLSSDDFIQQNQKKYAEMGLSEKKSLKMAEQMRDYLTASLIGDTDSMEKIEHEMATTMTGKGLSKESWDVGELFDTVAATTALTAVTGLPGTVSTAYQGATLKENLGDEGIKALAKTAVDFDDPEIAEKAQVMSDRLDEGKGITDTQAYELKKATEEQQMKDTQRVASSLSLAKERIDADDLLDPYTVTQDGNIIFSKQMQTAVNENVKSAKTAIRTVNKEYKDDVKLHLSTAQVNAGANAIAHFQAGVMTISDANNLTYGNKVVRQVFQEQTGVDLEEFVVKGKDGKINIPATNAATKDALFARATENLVASAQAETVEWMDHTKGDVVDDISARMGAHGSLAVQQTLDDIDERDRDTYMLHANAADLVYQTARNMGTEWDTVKDNYTTMFPEISESKLRSMYEAGLADRAAAEDTARGRAVEIGKSLSDTGEQETATGQVFVETKEPPKGTVIRLFSELANNLGSDIHLVDHLGTAVGEANGAYDPNTNTFYINVNNAPETNLGYIFMHEVTHYLRVHAPEEYLALENLVREKWFQADSGAMQNAIAKKIAQYSSEQNLTEDQALEEIIADSAHEFLNDPNFAKQVAEENPTLAKAMVDAIKRVLRILRRMFLVDGIDDTQMDSLFSQLDIMTEAEALWLDAYKTAVRNRGNQAIDELQDEINGDTRFAIAADADQEISSANTSINKNKLPVVFNKVDWQSGTTNFDNGGGKFDNATDFLKSKGVTNYVYDRYNRTPEHNQSVSDALEKEKADTGTISNVLNVIQEKASRIEVLENSRDNVKPGGNIYITVYEGNGSGVGAETKSGYQLNQKLKDYLAEVQEVFPDAYIRKGMIIAPNTEDQVRFSISDSDYMDAVNRGDMETAQRMVDQAAKDAGFDTRVFHGSDKFGFTSIDNNAPGADGFSFWAADREDISATYTRYGKQRPISKEITDEDVEEMQESVSNEIDDAIDRFRKLIDNTFSEWFFGQQDNSYLRKSVYDSNPTPGYGDGVYDTLDQIVAEAYYDYRDDYDFDEWQESDEAKEIYETIVELEALRSKADELERGEIGGGVYGLYANTDNLYRVDAKGNKWNELYPEGLPKKEIQWKFAGDEWTTEQPYRTREVAEWARNNGYDGVVFENIKDNGAYGRTEAGSVYAFFNPQSQVKSADPVTYDDNGNVIPLSQRFNTENPDIRYSLNEAGVDLTEGGTAVKYSLSSWNDTDKKSLIRRLVQAGFEKDVARKWVDDINSIAAIIASDRTRLDYIADRFQKALKDNDEYYKTLDLSTLCAKRRLYQGTYNAIMHRLKDRGLQPEDTVRLRQMMDQMGYETPCGICYEESRKKNEGKFAERWLYGDGDKWAGYKNMEHDDPYIPTLDEVTTTDGRAKLREEHPDALEAYLSYQRTRGSANPKVSFTHTDYREDIKNLTKNTIEKIKHIGGLRIQSFSDFEVVHVIDMMQAIMDMSAKNLTAQAYTKVPAFADIFGGTGIKINLSLIGQVKDGKLWFDSKEGINPDEAFRIREKYPDNVGTIIVGANEESILAAWADPRIDMVIPFHRSGWAEKEFEALGLGDYDDFQAYQSERYLDGSPNGIGLKDAKMDAIYSEDYWDYSKTGKENAEAYLKLCAEKHYRPVFYNFLHDNGDGTWSLQEDGSTDGYWKSLIDYKMYDNSGKGVPQTEVQPIFDMDVAADVMAKYEGNADTLPVAEDVVDKFVDELAESNRYSLSDTEQRDRDYMSAVESGNMEEAQRLVDEAAKEAGYGTEVWHGSWTDSPFTVFDPSSGGRTNKPGWNWVTTDEEYTKEYTSYENPLVMHGYINTDGALSLGNIEVNAYSDSSSGIKYNKPFKKLAEKVGMTPDDLYKAVNNDYSDYGEVDFDVIGDRFADPFASVARIPMFAITASGAFREAAEAAGYNIVKAKEGNGTTTYGLANSSQFKSSDPVTYAEDGSVIPLSERFDPSNLDIRYSMPTQDSQGNVLTNGQMEFFKDSMARDDDGRLLRLYHGTSGAGFTEFRDVRDGSADGYEPLIWMTTSRMDANAYGGNIEDKFFDPNEAKQGDEITAGDYNLSDINSLYADFRFDTDEDRQEFLDKHPTIGEVKSQETLDDMWDSEELSDEDYDELSSQYYVEDEKIRNDYWKYEVLHTKFATVKELLENPDQFTRDDAAGAFLTWDKEGEVLEEHTKEDILDAIREGVENNPSLGDLKFRVRLRAGETGRYDTLHKNRTYPLYANLVSPMIVDAHGEHMEDGYHSYVAEMRADDQYDGIIIKNVRVGAYKKIGDVVISKYKENVKDVRNANPTDDPDIRFSIPSEKEAKDYIASVAEDTNDIPLSDPVLEENRVRYAISKNTFVNSVRNRWSEGWGELENLPQDIPKAEKSLRMIMREVRRNSGTKKQYKSETLKDVLKDVKQMHKLLRKGSAEEFANLAWTAAEKIVDDIDYNDDMYTKYAEVRKYLDKTVITVPEELMTDDDFVEFCRDQEGFIRFGTEGTSLDDAYNWLSEKHPDMFPSEVEDPVDKIMQIAEVLDYTTPYREVYSSEEYANLVSDVANNLCSLVENSRDYKTTVDKLNVDAMNQRHQEAVRKVEQKYEGKLEEVKAQKEAQRQRAERWKERYNERVQQNIRERKERKEKKEHKKKFDRIVKNYNELCRWVLEPTKEKNVPEEFRKVIAEFLQTLDLQTENSKKLEEKTGHAASKTLRMRELKDKLKAFAEGKTESDGSYVPGGFELDAYASYILDMLSDEYDGKPVDSLDATSIGHVDTLLRTIMHNVKRYRQIKTETRTIPLQDIGRRSVEFLKAKINRDGVYGKRRGALGALETINTSALTPAYLFDRLGPLKEMYDALRHNGFDKYIRNERMIIDKLNEILGKYNKVDRKGRNKPGSEIEKWRNDSEAVTVELTNGQSVTMSVAQVMSLYCLAKRGEQALGHMMVGGIVVTPIQTGSKIEASKEKLGIKRQNGTSEKYVLAYEDIQNIISKLSSDQKSVADQLQKFMSEDMAKLGNEAHRELYGYDMFNEKNYFPIKVHGNERPTDINTIGDVIEKIKSFGFTKPLTPRAGQAIEIDDIFSVVADHCNGMNLYNAYLVPITDFMKVFNYSHLFENGESLTMKEAIAQAYGSDILKYIMNLIKDVNGIKGENRGGLEGLMNRALGTAKRTAVFGNIRVALQQPTAILRAAAEISPKYLMKALNPKNVKGLMPGATTADMEEMWKYCPISQWKAWGYYDTYMGRDIEDVMMNNWSIGDTMLAGYYGQLDNLTWSMIWQAVKAEQADLHPKMDTKSEEFLNLCGRRASEIFDKTQVVDSTFHRSDAMRSPQVATKVFTAFMAEPTLTLNVFRAGLFHASELFKSGNKAKAIGVLNKTFSVIIAQAILVAAAQAVADAWREKDPGLPWDDDDDDDKEKAGYFERFLHNFVYNVFDQLHLENNMYLVKDVTPYLNYMISQGADYMGWNPTLRAVMGWDQDYLYSQNNLVFAGLENTANGVAQFFKKLSKGDDYKDYNTGEPKKWYDIIQKIASGVGTFTGIPLGTLMRDAKPIIKKLIPEVYAADLDFMNSIFSKGDSDETKGGDSDGSGMSDKDINAKVDAYRDGLSDEFDDDQKKKLTKQYEKSLRASTGTTEEKPEEDFDYQMEMRSLKATEKAAGKTGVEKDAVLWDVISDGYSKYIEDGDMESVQAMKDVYLTHGGSEAYFDNKVVTKMQSIYKKTIFSETESDDENLQKQDMMRRYMLDHGVTAEELSEMCYKTYTARDLKAALRMGNEKYIMDELIPLVRAGLSRDDFEKLVKYQNYGAKTYDGKYSDPKYRKSTGNLVWPTQGQITSEFGYRNAPTAGASSNHPAIDIGASQGSPVVAADGGKVISAGNAGGYGNQVAIQHDNGMVTYYSHLYSWNVKVGDTVAQGQQVGQVGSTGISTGPHLDFKVEVNGEPVNPLEYLSR